MFYSIRHVTRFRYSAPVRESVMELRMQPRSEGPQTLRSFQIATNPRAQLYAYTDHLGNAVYHFNMLREHEELRIEAQAVVEITQMKPLPEKVDPLEWGRYNSFNLHDDQFDMSDALISIAVSLAAVAALAETRWLLFAAWGFGGFGLLMGIAGFAGWAIHPNALASFLS